MTNTKWTWINEKWDREGKDVYRSGTLKNNITTQEYRIGPEANLIGADLTGANLTGANLSHAILVKTKGANFSGAVLSYK